MKEIICLLFPLLSLGCTVTKETPVPTPDTPVVQETPATPTTVIPDIPVIPVPEPTQNRVSKNSFSIEPLSGNGLEINPISNIDSIFTGFDLTGTVTNSEIDLIRVKFQNDASNFPDDDYVLQTFKKGNPTFLYRAHRQYDVFDDGPNVYTVEWYASGDRVASIKLIVTVGDPSTTTPILPTPSENDIATRQPETPTSTPETPTQTTTAAPLDEENKNTVKLPKDEATYGHPIQNNGVVEYSNVPGFRVTQEAIPKNMVCQDALDDQTDLSTFLFTKYDFQYWNTCVPLANGKWIAANVLIIDKEGNYIYERQYIDTENGIYGKVLLEVGDKTSRNEISEKNAELKPKTYEVTAFTEKWFRDYYAQ